MCVDISLSAPNILIRQLFPKIKDERAPGTSETVDQLSAFTFPPVPIIYSQDVSKVLSDMEWGIDPFYIKDPKERIKRRLSMFNARSERILDDKQSYWYKLRNNRCLIPVSGTFEHRKIKGWKNKVPYYIWTQEREIIFIPALYQVHEIVDPSGARRFEKSFTMITRSANKVMEGIHNDGENKHRMPLFLTEELEQAWLLTDLKEADIREIFNFEMPSESMNYRTVYTLRGGAERPDGKHKYEFWNWENLPELGNDTPPQAQLSLF